MEAELEKGRKTGMWRANPTIIWPELGVSGLRTYVCFPLRVQVPDPSCAAAMGPGKRSQTGQVASLFFGAQML